MGDSEVDSLTSVRLRSRFLLNSFWRQLLSHYKARTEALCESIEKSPIDVNGSKARGHVPQFNQGLYPSDHILQPENPIARISRWKRGSERSESNSGTVRI